MRFWPVILLLALAGSAHAEVYRWVDQDGNVHYTDKPPAPDAKPAELPKLQEFPAAELPSYSRRSTSTSASEEKAGAASSKPIVHVISPTPDQTFRHTSQQVQVVVSVNPSLKAGQGLIYYFDGTPYNKEPTRAQSMTMEPVHRGTHLVSVAVVSAGKELNHSDSVAFHMKPPSVNRAR